MIDVANGFAYPAFDLAIAKLPAIAAETGIAAAGFVRSHHFGVAGRHVERLAEQGLLALTVSNTPNAMAAWGGKRPVFGTNPIAFAAPRRGAPPLVIDMALSEVARGKIVTAAQKGEPIPLGWAVDANGQPTTDAKAALAGTLVPAGGAKGAALALMVEMLAVALTGANFAFEASSFLDATGPPPGVGQVLIAIDPGGFAGAEIFADRLAALAGVIEARPRRATAGVAPHRAARERTRRNNHRRRGSARGCRSDRGTRAELIDGASDLRFPESGDITGCGAPPVRTTLRATKIKARILSGRRPDDC